MSVTLGSPWSGASAWCSITGTGALELELYDHSDEAASSLGGDVAWIWTVEPENLPRIRELLDLPPDWNLLEALANCFPHVHAVRDWLKAQGIPFTERFDSQA